MKIALPIILTNILFLAATGCSQAPAPTDPIPPHSTFKTESIVLDETRVICVWTPPEYDQSKEAYPVLYMPDGGINEDFPHIANTVSKLVADRSIPPTILVGIENTERRRDLTGPSSVPEDEKIAPLTDGASKFRQFIADELFVEIKNRYRITDQRSIIGESAAGLFVVETLLLKPEMFNAYIAMDPALHWNDTYLVRTATEHLANLTDSPRRFWFAGSNAGDIQPHTRRLESILKDSSPNSLEWLYLDQPDERHTTIFRAAKETALIWALNPNN